MFRAERSGVLSGLSRVRQINLDDTHVFCRPDQVAAEVIRALRSALEAPVQICVLPVGAAQDDAARALVDDLTAAGLRVRFVADGSLGARIRASRQRRDALIAVLGAQEVAAGRVQLTDVAAGYRGRVSRDGLLDELPRAYAARASQVDWPVGE